MNILHVITTIERGGAENQLLILTREQIKQGHTVTVLPLKGKTELQAEFNSSGVSVDLLLMNETFFSQLLKFNSMKENFEVVHLHLPRAELLGTMSRKKGRTIVSKHNTEPFFPGSNRILSTLLARFVAKRSDKIIAISESVSTYLYQNKEVSNQRKIDVVLYGYDNQEISHEVSEEYAEIRKNTQHLIVTVSRLVPQKDLFTLIKVVWKLKDKWPDVQLIIYGSGPLHDELKAMAENLGIFPDVHFLGRTSNPKGAMAKSDLFVLTSKYEGFGLVLVEAMAAGVPIVAARNSAIPEVLGSEHPTLFSTSDVDDLNGKISDIFSNSSLAEDIVAYQSKRLEEFVPDKMAHRILEVYNNAAK